MPKHDLIRRRTLDASCSANFQNRHAGRRQIRESYDAVSAGRAAPAAGPAQIFDRLTRPEGPRAWYLAEIEVIARVGPGPDGWKLEAWRYVGTLVDRTLATPKVEEYAFAGRGSNPLDAAIEQRLQDHLYRRRLIIDDLWERHVRDREAVMDLRMTG